MKHLLCSIKAQNEIAIFTFTEMKTNSLRISYSKSVIWVYFYNLMVPLDFEVWTVKAHEVVIPTIERTITAPEI